MSSQQHDTDLQQKDRTDNVDQTAPQVLLVGAGYVGTALALELRARGVDCVAAVASKGSAERLKTLDIDRFRLDLDSHAPPFQLPRVSQVVYLVPPKRGCDEDLRLELLLRELPATVTTLLYVSTSGVYGDHQGSVVDETTPPSPYSARARRRLDAETKIRQYADQHAISWVITRVPGIYGPGRLPVQSILDRRAVIREEEANPGNRIHRDDLAFAMADLLGVAQRSQKRTEDIYNTGDDCHMSSTEFAAEVARQAGLEPQPQISRAEMKATASSVRWSFLAESRRLDSRKLQRVLTKPWRYANPVDGIRASLEAGDDPAA